MGPREPCLWVYRACEEAQPQRSPQSVSGKRSRAYAVRSLRLDTEVGGRRPAGGETGRNWRITCFCIGNCSIHWVVTNLFIREGASTSFSKPALTPSSTAPHISIGAEGLGCKCPLALGPWQLPPDKWKVPASSHLGQLFPTAD